MEDFQGFKERHFAGAMDARLRTLDAVGSIISRELSALRGRSYEWWPVDHGPEIHIARPEHYDEADPGSRASLFVLLGSRPDGTGELVYGFRVAGPPEGGAVEHAPAHWHRFVNRVCRDEAMETALLDSMANYGLELSDYHNHRGDCGALRSRFAYRDRRLQWALPGRFGWGAVGYDVLRERTAALEDGAETPSAGLHLFALMPADEAVEMGGDAVESVTTVLAVLAPIYEMIVRA
jgi:hypothetical protein